MSLYDLPIDKRLLERINPVFNTAKMTLFHLASAGDKDAIAISDKLGLTLESTQDETSMEELLNNAVSLEIRFRTMGEMALKSGFPTIVDLPCGYTPRAIEFSRLGKSFVGLDLPAAVSEGTPIITSMIDEDKRGLVRFDEVDATNYESLKKVFDEIPGEVCITTEGLLMYFTDSETGELCDNMRRILLDHGGCWLLADVETVFQTILNAQAMLGDRFMEVLVKGKERAQNRSDVVVSARTLVVNPDKPEENMKKAMEFLAEHGLKAERLIVADYAPELLSFGQITPQQAGAIRQAMKKYAYWKITPIEATELDTKAARADNFDLKAEFSTDRLVLHLQGRLDTLSSPGFLAFYEKTVGYYPIVEVYVDCSDLEYISSAGLRVLLIMQKQCKRGVTLQNINNGVREILEQTGFDTILGIE
ncbi:MAG: STAS domain-containing protein [Butyrivibrio sp.]|nr:STAS domain-containing protein [Butyrivibrio sp.]